MKAILGSASPIIRLLVAAAMIIAPLGVVPAAAVAGPHAHPAYHLQDASTHDCCDPEPAVPDGHCALACAQAPCGWSAVPAAAGWLAPIDRLPVRWETASVLMNDTAPETATPPPRA